MKSTPLDTLIQEIFDIEAEDDSQALLKSDYIRPGYNEESDMAPLKSEIADLKSEMTEIKSDISDLKSIMTEIKSDISGLKSILLAIGKSI